jgi:hypothetical protein
MSLEDYLSATDRYLDKILSTDLSYFPLSFTPRNSISQFTLARANKPSLKELVLTHSRLAIVGPPGAGKTRAARDLAKVFCTSILRRPSLEGPVPLYIPLRHLPASTDHGMIWADVFVAPLNYTLSAFDCHFATGQHLARIMRGRDLIILLDGLNEIHPHELRKVLSVLETLPARSHVVLTSRIREYPTEYKDYAVYDIQPLSFPTEVHGFLKHMLASDETRWTVSRNILRACEDDAALRHLATNSYLLSQLFHLAHMGVSLPHDRTSLLELVVDNLVHELSLDENVVKAFLVALAGEMQFKRETLKLSVGDVASIPRQGVIADPVHLTNMLAVLIDIRLLVGSSKSSHSVQREIQNDDEIAFHHQVFQEYFAGVHLYEQQLRSATVRTARRAIQRYGKSRWNWEAICTAVVLLIRDGKRSARKMADWLVRTRPHLTALIQSEMPESAANIDYNLRANELLIKRLRRGAVFWALWIPHVYNWLPALLIGIPLSVIWSVWPVAPSLSLSVDAGFPVAGLPVLIALACLLPITYMIFLSAIYNWLDDALFDRRVHLYLASLELLRFRGGREALRDLRMRATANPFITERMKSWIVSSPVVPLVDVGDQWILGLPESRKDVTPGWVASLFERLNATATREADCFRVVEALSAALRILGSEEALHITICQGLRDYLKNAPKGRVRTRIVAALEIDERTVSFWARRIRHWRRDLPVLVFIVGAVPFAFATYFGWPTIVRIFLAVVALNSALSGTISVIRYFSLPKDFER